MEIPGQISAEIDTEPVRRTQLLGWRITCSQCGSSLSDNEGNAIASPINSYWTEALNGQRLINDVAEHGFQSWAPPLELARLLLMRRDPRTSISAANGNPRLLGVVVPEIDAIVANSRIVLPSPAKPILPLLLRPAQLAAVAILERQGPFMLARLEAKMIGQNRSRFRELATTMLGITPEPAQHYHYCSIIDNIAPRNSQISCSNGRELAHSYN